MLNFNRYIELKTAGVVILSKKNNAFVVSVKKFCPDTGVELTPEEVGIDKATLLEQKNALSGAIAGIDALVSDLDKLK